MSDADLQYGPTPEDAQHEHTDIEPSIAWKFAVWLSVGMLISAGIVYGVFWLFEGQEQRAQEAAQVFPLAAGQLREPPTPRLQTQAFKDVYLLREAERERLTTYGWVDETAGIVRIPIDEAMDLLIQAGRLQMTPAAPPDELNQRVIESSAGRMVAGR